MHVGYICNNHAHLQQTHLMHKQLWPMIGLLKEIFFQFQVFQASEVKLRNLIIIMIWKIHRPEGSYVFKAYLLKVIEIGISNCLSLLGKSYLWFRNIISLTDCSSLLLFHIWNPTKLHWKKSWHFIFLRAGDIWDALSGHMTYFIGNGVSVVIFFF